MKKNITIRIALIALMICAAIAIPVFLAMQAQALSTNPESTPLAAETSYNEDAPDSPDNNRSDNTDTVDSSDTSPASEPDGPTTSQSDNRTTNEADTGNTINTPIENTEPVNEVIEETPPACCGYCGSADHSYDYCSVRSIDNGALGRWSIPAVGVNVACYYFDFSSPGTGRMQAAVDAWDSAALIAFSPNQHIIGDHNNQGFNAIKQCSVGTRAYMDYGSYKEEYICVGIEKGCNAGGDLTDESGTSFTVKNPNGITCYTCNSVRPSITLVYFQPVA